MSHFQKALEFALARDTGGQRDKLEGKSACHQA